MPLTALQIDGAPGDTAAEVALDLLQLVVFGIGGFLIGAVVSVGLSVIALALRRRDPVWKAFSKRLRLPQRLLLVTLGTGIGILFATQQPVAGSEVAWRPVFVQVFSIALILVSAYALSALLFAVEDAVLLKFEKSEETGHARRVRTQMQLMRRMGIALIWLSAIVGVLMTFPAFRGIGATFFASAGLASVVAGIALQSTLGNIFAGVQIAFSDSIRVGDAVVVETQFGRIEELTLTYVVVRLWDNRRIILPSTYFTNQPFENWTRQDSDLLGTVMMDVDWFTPIPALRIELQRIVESTDLWDGETAFLQVTDAVNGKITLRAVVSAANPPLLWDLRCHVRESLVEWMQKNASYSVPRYRIEPNTTTAPPAEDRQEFIDDVQRAWEETRPAEEPEEESAPEPEEEDSVFSWLLGKDDPAKRARREAEKADLLASRLDPTKLAGHDLVLPLPSQEETRLLTPDDLAAIEAAGALAGGPASDGRPPGGPDVDETGAEVPVPEPERTSIRGAEAPVHHRDGGPGSAESRLYAGSPGAEERARLMEGPPPEDMAEREELAKRRQRPQEENGEQR
nr:mechanosensitive ion channel [Actinomycetales bacterium]